MKSVSENRRKRLFAEGAIIGVAIFLIIYGVATLDVTNDSFCRGGYVEKDIQQHYAGWLFYLDSAESWPLCVTKSAGAPNGISIAYTDSIPLVAAVCRPIAKALGGTFQYFGWFTLICFALQGGFAALLCGLFCESVAGAAIGSVLFVTCPVLIERAFRHTSLGAQWLVLAALYGYFRCRRENRCYSAGLFAVNVLAVGIHPYFLPMTYAVTLALVLENAFASRRFARPLALLCCNMAATALLGWSLGLLYGDTESGGIALYGYFAMNLNSLWNPVGVGGVMYSRVLPAQKQVLGNYDAAAYLGLGVLIALPAALVAARHRIIKLIKEHWALCLVCAALTAFAVSNTITANSAVVSIPLPYSVLQLCSMFRSGGRMFWPIYYLLLLAAFWGLARLPRGWAWVALCVAVQLFDISPALISRRDAMQSAQYTDEFPTRLESSFWQLAAEQYTRIESVEGIQDDSLHLALFAADNNMTTDDPFSARYDAAALAETRSAVLSQLAQGILREDTLYLFEDEGSFLQSVEPVKQKAWCGRVTCADSSASWYVIAPKIDGESLDELCIAYDENYPLRLAEYTDLVWNLGVMSASKDTVCFKDSPFARVKLEGAEYIRCDGVDYEILSFDDSDSGWLIVTLDIDDATVLVGRDLDTK